MNNDEILYQLNHVSDLSEKYFLDLGNLFTSLLNRETGSSLQNLQGLLEALKSGNLKASESELALFNGYDDKYTPLFEELNNKIATLSELDKLIAGIKEDSEQMELIALNAMVISIKSGEKGQAFSRITENLQRLSKDMFLFSDKLLDEETQLIKHINNLKEIFTNILNSQKDLASKAQMGTNSINELISTVASPLKSMEAEIDTIYPPIQKSMENLQLQDIIRQALNHVKSCLEEVSDLNSIPSGSDQELDAVCFNIALYNLCEKVLEDITNHATKSFLDFDQNWSDLTTILMSIDSKKSSFTSKFIDPAGISPDNLNDRLAGIINHYSKIMNEFSQYHLVQKDLLHTTQSITEKARTMYTVFGNLRPVMSRLHHVRILQQIEVSKNEAIKSVRDSVTDMDNLIKSSNDALDVMEDLLSKFIKNTTSLLTSFNSNLTVDNQKMIALRKEKATFFEALKGTQGDISSVISHFEVFPEGFSKKCEKVATDLSGIQELNLSLKSFKQDLSQKTEELNIRKAQLLSEKNLHDWNIQNTKFSEIINKFTITAHKEAAGQIGGFSIEHGAESGEITFF